MPQDQFKALSEARKLGGKTHGFTQFSVEGRGQCAAWVALWLRRRIKRKAFFSDEALFELLPDDEVGDLAEPTAAAMKKVKMKTTLQRLWTDLAAKHKGLELALEELIGDRNFRLRRLYLLLKAPEQRALFKEFLLSGAELENLPFDASHIPGFMDAMRDFQKLLETERKIRQQLDQAVAQGISSDKLAWLKDYLERGSPLKDSSAKRLKYRRYEIRDTSGKCPTEDGKGMKRALAVGTRMMSFVSLTDGGVGGVPHAVGIDQRSINEVVYFDPNMGEVTLNLRNAITWMPTYWEAMDYDYKTFKTTRFVVVSEE
jgi:hypothetical protein